MVALKPILVHLDRWENSKDPESVVALNENFGNFYNGRAGALFLLYFSSKDRINSISVQNLANAAFTELESGFRGKIDHYTNRANDLIEALEGKAKLAGVTEQSGSFKRESNFSFCMGVFWLILSIIFGVSILQNTALGGDLKIFGWVIFNHENASVLIEPTLEPSLKAKFQFYYGIASKIGTVLVFVTALLFCLKMLRVSFHQYFVNRHRMIALESLHLFSEADEDTILRSAFLLQVIQSVFRYHSTGLVPNETSADDADATEILQKLRDISITAKNTQGP